MDVSLDAAVAVLVRARTKVVLLVAEAAEEEGVEVDAPGSLGEAKAEGKARGRAATRLIVTQTMRLPRTRGRQDRMATPTATIAASRPKSSTKCGTAWAAQLLQMSTIRSNTIPQPSITVVFLMNAAMATIAE